MISLWDRFVWGCYEIENVALKRKYKDVQFVKRIQDGKVCGQKAVTPRETHEYISKKIQSGEPFWAGRMGFVEMNLLRQFIEHRMAPFIDHRETALRQLCKNAGFFPYDLELGERYVDLVLADSPFIDLQGYWGLYMEDYIHKKYQKKTIVSGLPWLEPWQIAADAETGIKPWTAGLKGKNVLVVHPFAKSISQQYEKNREKIFSRHYRADDILPQFHLKTLQAVQTIAGNKDDRFENWFEALDWMKSECRKVDFDIAIVGCGAYGFNLAAEIKRMGKQVIHLGGATQVLFGISGRRWETEYASFDLINECWVRPSKEETVAGAKSIENGCYW